MSILCQTFVQNAWRSDLCSNCFKSLDDHSEGTTNNRDRTRYVPQAASLYQRPQWRLSDPVYERVSRRDFGSQTPPKEDGQRGILIKDPGRKLGSRPNVDFASEEALVIGYGGNDYDSDVSPWEMGSDDGSIDFDLLDDTDEGRNITKLTKNNTQFNSSNQNLLVTNKDEKMLKNEKQIIIKNNNNIKVSEKASEKSLSITYNDIQTDKIVSHYYYPSTTESLKLYMHSNSDNNKESNEFKNNNSVNLLENYKADSFKHERMNICEENSKNFLSEDFSPLNTRTYSFVSDINKNKSFEHSSDSDYSTCRLTAGDSTDSESFHDAEDSRIEPCSSFLHGNYPKSLSTVRDKKYDGNSSTSGDVSNLSDDSDTHESTKKTVYKSKSSSKNTKSSPETQDNKSSMELVTISTLQHATPTSMNVKTIPVRLKESTSISTSKTKENSKSQSFKIYKEASEEEENEPYTQIADAVNTSIESRFKNTIQKDVYPKNNPDTSKTSTPATNIDEGFISKASSISINHTKSTPRDKPVNGHSDALHKKLRKSVSADNKASYFTNNLPVNDGVMQNESLVEKHLRFSDEVNDCEASPDTIAQRQSKLAALALELELARRDSLRPNNMNTEFPVQMTPPQIEDVFSPAIAPSNPLKDLSSSPSKLPETPTKVKKNRFSLKKLLKRNKDSGNFTPEAKAWKKQTFDRSRLSLEIVHPMDLANDTSGESTPTDHPSKAFFKTGYNRTRSLSALPQVSGESNDQSNCSLLDCRKVETLPARKAGTVAERKKNRPSLVRTPSCSALPSRHQPPDDRSPPPKPPPPPPKYKIQHPPPPPPPPTRCPKANYPARPPPPKIPDVKIRNSKKNPSNEDKEYANLGDIRSQLMPKKPDRASALSASREGEEGLEEDHYTYLDEAQGSRRKPWMDLQESYSAIAAANYDSLAEIITSSMSGNNWKLSGKSLKFKDFVLEEHQIALRNKIVCNAVYKNPAQERIMLLIIPRDALPTRQPTRYPVLTSFIDYLPKEFLVGEAEFASVYVLPRSHLSTFQQFSSIEITDQHIQLRNYCFVLLQLIHTLKGLQAEGFEEVNFDLKRLVMISTHEDKPPTFILLPEDKTYLTLCETSQNRKTLCQAILETLYHFLNIDQVDELKDCFVNGKQLAQPVAYTFSAIAQVLVEEKASSLTQAKGLLEYMLWGPVDVSNTEADDTVLQRWLDLQRAQMIKSTISQLQRKEISMHVFEEYQLIFLLQASVKSLKNVISKL